MEVMDEHAKKMGYVLIVDNDPTVRRNVSEYFSNHNIPTISAPDWNELKCTDRLPSLIVMDRQTSRNDGLDRLRSIRSKCDVPVIMIGHVPDEMDRVIGLELGADDYVVKPFGLRESLARARAILRRRGMASAARTGGSERGGYRFGAWRLERRSRRLVAPHERPVSLSKGEYALLWRFSKHRSDLSHGDTCCRRHVYIRTFSIAASMCRSRGFGGNWKSIQVSRR